MGVVSHPLLSEDANRSRALLAKLVRDGQQVATKPQNIAHATTLRRLATLGLVEVVSKTRPARTCVRITSKGRDEVQSWSRPPVDTSSLWSTEP